jgi:uncharacterized protein YndB with AHSA1/START domain
MNSKITVITQVRCSIDKAWKYWTEPQHIVGWNFASDDWYCPKVKNDLQVGGQFSYTMSSKDGQFSFDFEGIYDEVNLHSGISYTLADDRKVIVLFEAIGNMVLITEKFDPETINSEDLQKAGWQAILDNFKKYSESKGA